MPNSGPVYRAPSAAPMTERFVTTGRTGGRMMIRSTVRRKPGQRRSPVESKHGDELSASGRWVRVHRIVDRRRNFYYEKVHDPETREVLRDVEEPLTEHRGRGSARKR